MAKFTVTYRLWAVKTIEARDEDEAETKAYDDPPYPDVDGGDCDAADIISVTIEQED